MTLIFCAVIELQSAHGCGLAMEVEEVSFGESWVQAGRVARPTKNIKRNHPGGHKMSVFVIELSE